MIGTIGAIALGVGALGSAAIGAGAAGKASDASQRAADAAAAETRAAREQAYSTLNPYIATGTPAMGQINALLGLGGDSPGAQDWAGYMATNPDLQQAYSSGVDYKGDALGQQFGSPDAFAQWHYQNYGQNEGRAVPTLAGTSAADKANAAFDTYRNSTGYDFRVKQGMNALNSGYAGAGTIKSGAAMKGAVDYGQGMASQEFGNYLNALGNQQAIGLQAGSAAAGVGMNAANSLGTIYQQNGENQANAALARGKSFTNALGGLANGILQYGTGGGLNADVGRTIRANPGIF